MSAKAPRLQTLLVSALVLVALVSLVTVLPGDAQAQRTCDDNHPLYIEEVLIRFTGNVDPHEDSMIFEDKAAFLHEGDEVEFRLVVQNLLNNECGTFPGLGPATNDLTLKRAYEGDGWDNPMEMEDEWDPIPNPVFVDCTNGEVAAGETCTTRWYPLPGNRQVKGDDGEQRVRFMIQNGEDRELAGAERILVVNQLPDLEPGGLTPTFPANDDDRHTTYDDSDSSDSRFDVAVQNNGAYPNWNPNGGNEYASRSSYVGNDTWSWDLEDPQTAETGSDHRYACQWVGDGDAADDEPVCSYRRGEIFDLPIQWELIRDGEVVAEGVDKSYWFSDASTDNNDRADAIAPGPSEDVEIDGPSRNGLAGTYDMRINIDQDPNEAQDFWTPESDDENNDITEDVNIYGVDLDLTQANLRILGGFEDGLCNKPDGKLCQPDNHAIRVDPRFEVAGDSEIDGKDDPFDRWFNVGVTLLLAGEDEETIAHDADSEDPIRKQYSQVPELGEERDLDDHHKIDITSGGKHTLLIRIDHPLVYSEDDQGFVPDENGRVAELTEQPECPEGYDDPSTSEWDDSAAFEEGVQAPSMDIATNTYCIDLYFDEPNVPEIGNETIVFQDEDKDPFGEETPTILEGEDATFQAEVTSAAGIDRVNATFILPEDDEGEQATINRTMTHAGGDVYEVDESFEGNLGEHEFYITAWDTLDQPSSGEPAPFVVEDWPKNITTAIGVDELNGETTVVGDNAPQFQGTVSEPDNWFNLTVNVTDTGHEPQPGDVHFRVWDPDGVQRVEKTRLAPMTVCFNQTTGQNTWGENCDDENFQGPLSDDKGAEWTSWYVDTRDDETWNHPNLTLPWVGEFNVEVIVKDAFGRTNNANWTAQLRDVGPAELTNATLSPTNLVPGDQVHASGEASDPLRVERVFLNVTKPSGETAQGDLTITQVHDAETQSGVWEATFDVGSQGDLFDQAGDYDVEMIADDFGTNPNSTHLGTVTIAAGDPPEILSLFTDPSEEAEAGINLTWTADIEADTAIEDPRLTITKGDGSTQTLTLTQDKDTGLWTATMKPDPLQPEETWTYELEVRDFADQVDTATGEILVLQNTAPHATNWQPNVQTDDGRHWINATPTLSVDLVDANGVNESTIHARVDGSTIWEDGAGDAQVEEIPQTCAGCYRLTYTLTDALEDGDTLTLEVEAAELSEDELESDWHTMQFHVDATPPSADLAMAPTLTVDASTVIGLATQIDATVEDAQSGPGDLRVTVESLAGTTAATREVEIVDGEISFQLDEFEEAFRGHGEYRIELEPSDAVGNHGDAQQERFLYDAASPQISIEPQLDRPASFLAVNITDISEITEVLVRFTPDDQPEQTIELERDGHLWVGEIVDSETGDPYAEGTEITYHIEAADYWANTGTTDTRTFIAGATPPSIAIDAPQDGDTIQGTIDVLWTATDEDVPDEDLNVSLWYSLPDGDPREITGATDLANTGQFELDTTLLPNGQVELQAIAFDGATFGSDTVTVTVRNLGDIFEAPELADADTQDDRDVIQPGQETSFQVRINQNVLQAWANVTKDGDTIASYELQDAGDGVWSAAFTAPEEEGDYDVDLSAMTTDGPVRADSAYGFTVQTDDKSFLPEWTILTVLFAGAIAVGAFGLTRRWG